MKNKDIVRFQNLIKSDIIAPLDLITPTGDRRTIAEQRMQVSHKRIVEGLSISDYSILVGMQQEGRFFDLRQKHIRMLADVNANLYEIKYYGIGSLVPYFNKNHDLLFSLKVISDARSVIGSIKPMHVYGAGDPLEIPFMYYAGANVFDSYNSLH